MCAYRLGELGIQAIVLEKNREVGKKILISGGGRCNFTNREVGFENFRSHNPHYARSALARYTSGDFIDLVNQRGIDWYEKTLGQLFCKRSAREIVDLLRDGALANGSEIRTGVEVLELADHLPTKELDALLAYGPEGTTVRLQLAAAAPAADAPAEAAAPAADAPAEAAAAPAARAPLFSHAVFGRRSGNGSALPPSGLSSRS